MSNRGEKERQHVQGGALMIESSSNNNAASGVASKRRGTRKIKKPEESSVGAKKPVKVDVSVNEPRNSGAKTASTSESRQVASAEVLKTTKKRSAVKRAAPSEAQNKETRGRQETDQVAPAPSAGKQPDTPASKMKAKAPTSQQAWKEKAQPESSTKKSSPRKQPGQTSGSTSKPPTIPINSSPVTNLSKQNKVATQKQGSSKKPVPKDQPSQGKQHTHKASTSVPTFNSSDYPKYHIEWKGFQEPHKLEACCCLCENDIRVAPLAANLESDLYEYSAIPVVAILPCGHVFHSDCLSHGELEQQQTEPICVFCDSF